MRREVTFRGQRLGGGILSTVDDKVQAVKDCPNPQLCEGPDKLSGTVLLLQEVCLRVLLHSCSTIPAAAVKGETIVWTEECGTAFTSLQRALVEVTVLSPPDLALPFILDTNASSVGSAMCRLK